jgi:DNA-binding NarL/FixJ family response regulator
VTAAPRTIRVAIVDDHPVLREGTAALIGQEPDIEAVATPATIAELRTLLAGDGAPDVVIQDIRMGPESGLTVLGELAAQATVGPVPAVIVWTAYDYPQYAAYAYRAGAAGFVVKTAPTAELVRAIRQVADGALFFASRPDLRSRPLTPREREVLAATVGGHSNDEIAASLGITTRTVEAHLTRLYERFDLHSRTELVARAVTEGWLDVPAEA